MTYNDLLTLLQTYREEKFAEFQRGLILPPKAKILGVRTPVLRKIAKDIFKKGLTERLLGFPDEYYEVTFIKLTAVSKLPYESFLQYLPTCVSLIDNWALCDSFKANCIKTHKDEFLPELANVFSTGKEFYQRYALVMLLSYYCEENYFSIIKEYLKGADTRLYYVKMAAAWLFAEVVIKDYSLGIQWLKEGIVTPVTQDKAIQKARESFRLDEEKKRFLNSLKNKNKQKERNENEHFTDDYAGI